MRVVLNGLARKRYFTCRWLLNLLVWCPRPRSPPVSAALFLPSLLLYIGRRSSPQDFFFFYLLTKPFFSYYFLSYSKFGPSKVGKEHLLLGAVWCQGLQTPFLGLCSQRNDANANFYCNCMQDIWQGGSIHETKEKLGNSMAC